MFICFENLSYTIYVCINDTLKHYKTFFRVTGARTPRRVALLRASVRAQANREVRSGERHRPHLAKAPLCR